MFRRILTFLIAFICLTRGIEAKNKVTIKISCTIPVILELKSNHQDKGLGEKDKIIQEEERREKGKRIIIKTVLLR